MTTYEVYQPHTHGPEGLHSAITISRHRSPEAAQRAIVTALRRLRQQPGMDQSYYNWSVRARDTQTGDARHLTEAEHTRMMAQDYK